MDADESLWIGIDPSYSGMAVVALVSSPGIPGGLGTLHALDKYPAGTFGQGGVRLRYIYDGLTALFANLRDHFHVRRVAVEGYSPGSKFNREILGELGGIVRLAVHDVFGDAAGALLVVPPSAVKKFATGKGNAPKDNVLLAVYKKWEIEFDSNDLADAYTVARVARAMDVGTTVAYELAVLKALGKTEEDSDTVV
jgi:Holliday junction resolvasome RuvABC endonuclease subunit